jgi:hypothetical protein
VKDGKKKMHWRFWEWFSMTTPSTNMGFCHLALFNQVMLGRHGQVAATYGAKHLFALMRSRDDTSPIMIYVML